MSGRATPAGKLPPHSEEAEQSVLGAMMLSIEAVFAATDRLKVDDFYFEKHRLIFTAATFLASKNNPVDIITMSNILSRKDKLEEVGGMIYLGQLANDTPGVANVDHYAKIVAEKSALRRVLAAAADAEGLVYGSDKSSDQIVDEVERRVMTIRVDAGKSGGGPRPAIESWSGMVKSIQQSKVQGGMRGVPSGLIELDNKTRGLVPGDLIVVAGRPSMGKTTLAMNWAESVAFNSGKAALVFSLEMDAESLLMRFAAARASVELGKIRSGDLSDADWQRMSNVEAELGRAPLHVDATTGLNVMQIRSRARKTHAQNPLGVIVIDYLQRLDIVQGKDSNRSAAIGEVTRQLKDLGRELGVPVVLLSQLNRGVENRDNKRPRMSDLRESGEIEQDADLIVFVYRDEVYNKDSPEAGTAELIIGKQRNGEQGTVRVSFEGAYSRFGNLDPSWKSAAPPPNETTQRGLGLPGARRVEFF